MTDPMDALVSLQEAVREKTVQMQPCELHRDARVLLDHPEGTPRFTYALIENEIVQAISLFVSVEPVDGVPCFQTGYAVTASARGKGLGAKILQCGIDELTSGLGRAGIESLCIEAVVAKDNVHSNRIASSALSSAPLSCSDQITGEPAFQYLLKTGGKK